MPNLVQKEDRSGTKLFFPNQKHEKPERPEKSQSSKKSNHFGLVWVSNGGASVEFYIYPVMAEKIQQNA